MKGGFYGYGAGVFIVANFLSLWGRGMGEARGEFGDGDRNRR